MGVNPNRYFRAVCQCAVLAPSSCHGLNLMGFCRCVRLQRMRYFFESKSMMQMDDEQAQRLSASLESLSERIARLSIGLGIKLDDHQAVQQLMDQPSVRPIAVERRVAPATGAPTFQSMTGERRAANGREELRGLLVLRYQLEVSSLNDNGLELTREIVALAEYRLEQRGFKPGANGLDAGGLFNTH